MENNGREIGIIRRTFDTFGFISAPDGVDRFFHWSNVDTTCAKPFHHLRIGDRVSYYPEVNETPKGPRPIATSVLLVLKPNSVLVTK